MEENDDILERQQMLVEAITTIVHDYDLAECDIRTAVMSFFISSSLEEQMPVEKFHNELMEDLNLYKTMLYVTSKESD